MKSLRILMVLMLVGILAAGCSQEVDMTAPDNQAGTDKDGTEILGTPSIDIAEGTCFAQGGVGMVGKDVGILDITVPDGDINQVLLYWSGGTTGADGDNVIMIDGNEVTGTLIGGPTNFFSNNGVDYFFTAFRADITSMALVSNGANSFEITEFDFDFTGGTLDENHGIGMMVIYDDGTPAEIQLVDGLDVAFFGFNGDLQVTEPQTLTFLAEEMDRTAKMVIFSGSVGEGRPNEIHLTTSAGTDIRVDELNSADDDLWDTLCLEDVFIPAGDTSITVELVSTPSQDPLGASLTWIGCGLSVPVTPPDYCIGDYVWYDTNRDGCQDENEMPAEGVEVILYEGCEDGAMVTSTFTSEMGYYEFCGLMPGDYVVQFVAPEGYYFCAQYSGDCDTDNDSNAGEDGMTDCITIVDADDWSIDAALCVPTACLGDYVWEDLNMDGIQDDGEPGRMGVSVNLYDCEGNMLGSMETDGDGYYMFCDLEPGQYMVEFMLPGGYEFSPQDQGGDNALDSDADPVTGMTVCIDLGPGDHDMTWDAGIYMPVEEGCTLTIGFWKKHSGLGNGNQEDVLSQYLPITLGDAGGTKSLDVTDVYIAVDVLEQKTYGRPNNGITKLYAQLLAAKLNFASGASDGAVADYVADADAFLADHDWNDWDSLTDEEAADVMMWHGSFDYYNNGDIGPGHCEDDDDDEDEDEDKFK